MKKTCRDCGTEFEGGTYTRLCPTCRHKAQANASKTKAIEEWVTIPVAPKYEINSRGIVRNIKTGRICKQYKDGNCSLVKLWTDNDFQTPFAITGLMWMCHGTEPAKNSTVCLPILVAKGENEQYYFDSARKAAAFIGKRENYSTPAVRKHLRLRRAEIYGWRITYQR